MIKKMIAVIGLIGSIIWLVWKFFQPPNGSPFDPYDEG
jgi:flagellar biogenesis protein FliO